MRNKIKKKIQTFQYTQWHFCLPIWMFFFILFFIRVSGSITIQCTWMRRIYRPHILGETLTALVHKTAWKGRQLVLSEAKKKKETTNEIFIACYVLICSSCTAVYAHIRRERQAEARIRKGFSILLCYILAWYWRWSANARKSVYLSIIVDFLVF